MKAAEARVWDAATGNLLSRMRHEGAVLHAAFSPDGRRIATASLDGTARVWDAGTGQPLSPPLRHEGRVTLAVFSPDGRRVATVSREGTVWVWEADTREPIEHREAQSVHLITMARLISGMQVDQNGDLVPFTTDHFRAAWQELRLRYPNVFACSSQEILAWHWREAAACEEAKVWSWAVRHLDALIAVDPESWILFTRRGRAHTELGRWQEAITDASQAIALRPEHDQLWKQQGLWLMRGNAHAELGRWEQSIADLTSAIDQDPGNADPQIGLALAYLAEGVIDGYRKACSRLLREYGQRNDPRFINSVAWTCIVAPEALEDREAVVRCARAAMKGASKDSNKHDVLRTLGAATYRAGQFEEAIGHLNDALKSLPEPGAKPDAADPGGVSPGPTPGGDARDWLFLAMGHHRLGHAEEARRWLDKAVASINRATESRPEDTSSGSRIDWRTRLSYQVLRREAKGLIDGAGSGHAKAAGGEKSGQ
jgi:tetratricopeptide (TPR) repeat protein